MTAAGRPLPSAPEGAEGRVAPNGNPCPPPRGTKKKVCALTVHARALHAAPQVWHLHGPRALSVVVCTIVLNHIASQVSGK